jgi:hypothetical protein
LVTFAESILNNLNNLLQRIVLGAHGATSFINTGSALELAIAILT